jgi:hypothetical protein
MQAEEQRGGGAPRYSIIPRTLVFLTRDNDVLLLQGAPTKRLWAGKYNGLGGHIEPGETPYQAAVRKLARRPGWRQLSWSCAPSSISPCRNLPASCSSSSWVPCPPGNRSHRRKERRYGCPARHTPRFLGGGPSRSAPPRAEPGPCIFGEYHFTETGLVTTFDPE